MGLVPQYKGRKSTINPEVLELMEHARREYLRVRPRRSLKGVYNDKEKRLVKRCTDFNLEPPSFYTFKYYIYKNTTSAEFSMCRGRRYYQTHYAGSMGSFRGAIMPMQVLQFDSTSFDCFPTDSEDHLPLGTPNLVAAIDVYTKMVTGYYLSLAPDNRLSVLETLVQGILPKDSITEEYETLNPWSIQGFPVLILVDNGMIYRAEDVKNFCIINTNSLLAPVPLNI